MLGVTLMGLRRSDRPLVPPGKGSMIPTAAQGRSAAGLAANDMAEALATDATDASGGPSTHEILARYAKAHDGRAALGVATSRGPLPGAVGRACTCPLKVSVLLALALAVPDGRVPGAHVHRLPRLLARLVPRRPNARNAWLGIASRAAPVRAVPALAARPRRPSRHLRRPRAARRRRRPHADRRRIPRALAARAARLPAAAQPARDVRARPDRRDGDRPAHRRRATPARGCAAACSRPTSRSPCSSAALCWLIGWRDYLLVVGPLGAARRLGRDLAVLRPAPVRGRLLGERRRPGTTPTRRCGAAPT